MHIHSVIALAALGVGCSPDGSWSVTVWRLPKAPGGHRLVLIDKKGSVASYGRGERKVRMNPTLRPPETIDEYIASCPAVVQPILRRIRLDIRKAAPLAQERISYRMPAFFLDGVLVCFAAFKKHIGLFPPVRDQSLLPLVMKYSGPKGNLRFPLSEPIPYGLIMKIVKSRLKDRRARKP